MDLTDRRLDWSEHCGNTCGAILARYALGSLDDPRDRLAAKASDYVAELHSALLMALRAKHYAAAAAQLRLLMEGALSGLYLLHLDQKDTARALESGQIFLPSAKSMWAKCARLPVVGPNIRKIADSQGPFHKFTHGDMPQINRRKELGNWASCFSSSEAMMYSIVADTVLIGSMDTFSHAVKDYELQHSVRGIRDEILGEMRALGVNAPEDNTFSPPPRRGAG